MSVVDLALWGGHLAEMPCLSASEMGTAFGKGVLAASAWSCGEDFVQL
jgi:hypothetical protein